MKHFKKIYALIIIGLFAVNLSAQVTPEWLNFYNGRHIAGFCLAIDNDSVWSGSCQFNEEDLTATDWRLSQINMPSGSMIDYDMSNLNLPDSALSCIAIDSQGNKWIGFGGNVSPNTGGLCKFDGQIWTSYTTVNSGLPDNCILSIAIDSNNVVWVGTYNAGLARFDGVNWEVFNVSNSSLLNNHITDIAIDNENSIWLSTWNGGLYKYNGTAWSSYNVEAHGLGNSVRCVSVDGVGIVWVGTSDGLGRFDGSAWSVYTTSNTILPDNRITDIAFDSEGKKWISCYNFENGEGGVLCFDDTNWNLFDTSNSELPSNKVNVIVIDGNDTKWIGTWSGLAAYNENGITANEDHLIFVDEGISISNYPNPFNPTTTISYNLPNSGTTTLNIYNIKGQLIKQLADEIQSAGQHIINWNGKDNKAQTVASGMYLCRITSAGKQETLKMLLLK